VSSGPDLADDADWAELARYVSGQASTEEGVRIREWAAADPAHRLVLDQATAAWAHARRADVSPRTDAVWSALAAHLDIAAPHIPVARPHPWPQGVGGRAVRAHRVAPVRRPARWVARQASIIGAAAAAITVAIGLVVWRGSVPPVPRHAAMMPDRTYATARGERATVRLADGSRVALGPASTMRVSDSGGRGARTVQLEGEAVFDVAHDPARPFRVYAGNAITEDIGTRFDVRAYGGDGLVWVAVTEGAVRLHAAGTGPMLSGGYTVLRRGTLGIVDQAGETRVSAGVDADAYLAWAAGKLVFAAAPLADVVAELGRWYDLDIRLGDPKLANLRLTASFADDPIPDVLHFLEGALEVRAIQQGRTVMLVPR
jgi:transmembrane sensor